MTELKVIKRRSSNNKKLDEYAVFLGKWCIKTYTHEPSENVILKLTELTNRIIDVVTNSTFVTKVVDLNH